MNDLPFIRGEPSKRGLTSRTRAPWPPYLVLALALGLSILVAALTSHYTSLQAQRDFDELADRVQAKIAARMDSYIALVRSGAAFVSVYPFRLDAEGAPPQRAQLTRERFADYVARLRLDHFYPGVQGYGLTVRVHPTELDALHKRMRAEGYENFRIEPPHPRPEYHAIVYLQPEDARNQVAIGYDMYHEPVRREAMDRATVTAEPAMTGRVTLVQEITPQKQSGFLLYVPVYRGGAVPDSVEERREALQAFIYTPFRAADLLQGILSSRELRLVRLLIHDGPPTVESLLYDSEPGREMEEARFTVASELEIAGRQWTTLTQSRPSFEAQYASNTVALVLVGGVLLSLLLFFLAQRASRAFVIVARTMQTLDRSRGALAESQRRFMDMADVAPVMLWEAGSDGVRTYFNKTWLDFRGRTLAEERDGHWLEGVHPDEREAVAEMLRSAHAERRSSTLEYRLLRHDGEYRWMSERGVPRYNALGLHVGYIGSCIDVSSRKATEEELEQRVSERTAQLESANRELEAFSYSVSHDLRAPLRVINAFSTMLLSEYGKALTDDVRRMVERIRNGSVAMGQLIDDLLSFSRVGRTALKKQPVDVERLVQDVAQELCAAEDRRDVRLELDDMPVVEADPALLRQVFQNLLSNALKFTRTRETAHIAVGAMSNARPVFFVRDNGVGFDPRYADRMFGVFERLHSASEFEGTGVGLALVQRIIERHGGRIWAEAEPGRFAAFYFELGEQAHDQA